MNPKLAQELLRSKSGYSISENSISHTCQLACNLPCEDTFFTSQLPVLQDKSKDWCLWAVFDGHAGPRTAQFLAEFMPFLLVATLLQTNCIERPYQPNDFYVAQVIKRAFGKADEAIFSAAMEELQYHSGDLPQSINKMSPAISGSCALVSLFDPARSILRVANTGDSRAVLGRWDKQSGRYVAKPMSVDQTGFNQDEVERLKREHRDEEPVDPKTGRVHGIAVTRTFGDSRWKWPQELSQKVHDKFWGPTPRPDGMILTPPYLTAEPEIMETEIQTGEKPDFLIMASDGLWDNMSSEDAVTCVQQWLDKYSPAEVVEAHSISKRLRKKFRLWRDPEPETPLQTGEYDVNEDHDTYFDPEEKCLKWRVSPKHFIVEDDHCGMHLIKNALGGKRRNLFCGILSVPPPLARNVRDDVTVHVIFFGVDFKAPKKSG
ncbi:protein serine/threonine phosphatase 2C [Rhizodiscina lignyota]|uniref:Protein serine/threonine phosphatase 2C n=1 Tax=Rhizodiscina lignyota TaxID=1504668 RepID=A0A9P4M590_9PEZI|nr:protein serine/threonine phosphatase 2C [Rhizodiscina lignyota]